MGTAKTQPREVRPQRPFTILYATLSLLNFVKFKLRAPSTLKKMYEFALQKQIKSHNNGHLII